MLDEGRCLTPAEESVSTSAAAGLRFVRDDSKGIARKRRGKAFQYLMPSGAPLRTGQSLRASASLPSRRRGRMCGSVRRQRSHPGDGSRRAGSQTVSLPQRLDRVRDETKNDHLVTFARIAVHPPKRAGDMASRAFGAKVLATAVQLLETTMIRVGNRAYARKKQLWANPARPPRHIRRKFGTFQVGQERQEMELEVTIAASRASCAHARSCRDSISSSTTMTRESRARSRRPMSTPIWQDRRRRHHRQRLPHLVRHSARGRRSR